MKMTFHQYIQNPMGISNSVISNREMYRSMYTEKWNKIMLRENGKVDYKLYKKNSSYIVYIKIPSEVVENFYYDVVVEFTPPEKTISVQHTLENYTVKFYSNDPAFVYTYAHSFIKNGLFIDDLKPKMSKLAVAKVAKEKNPNNLVGYVKSLYFAWLVIKSRGLLNKTHYITATEYKSKELLSQIQQADEKIEERKKLGEELDKKKSNKKKADANSITGNTDRITNNTRNSIPKISKKTSMVSTVKSNKFTKTVSKVKKK